MPDWQDSGIYPHGRAGISFMPRFQITMWNRTLEEKRYQHHLWVASLGHKPNPKFTLHCSKDHFIFLRHWLSIPRNWAGTNWDALPLPGRVQRRWMLGLPVSYKCYKCFFTQREGGSKWLIVDPDVRSLWRLYGGWKAWTNGDRG